MVLYLHHQIIKTIIMATFFEAENDKSLRTKENAPFGGWEHYDERLLKEEAAKSKIAKRYDFIQDVKIKPQGEVLDLLVRKLKESEELYTMMDIMVIEIENEVRYKFNKEMSALRSGEFLNIAYPEVMSIIKRIDSMQKPWDMLRSTFDVINIQRYIQASH